MKANISLSIILTILFIAIPALAQDTNINREKANNADLKSDEKAPDVKNIVSKMDQTISGYDDQTMNTVMIIHDIDGSSKSYSMRVTQKGSDRRLVRFTSGENKGMAVLSLPKNVTYVYMPGYKRVRKVAAHAKAQNLAGSDFSDEDMSATTWADRCKLRLEEETNTHYKVHCTAIGDESWASVVFEINKETFFQDVVTYFNSDGKATKRMTNSHPIKWDGGALRHKDIRMDDLETGHYSEIELQDFKVNQGLKDSLFTVRRLTWGS